LLKQVSGLRVLLLFHEEASTFFEDLYLFVLHFDHFLILRSVIQAEAVLTIYFLSTQAGLILKHREFLKHVHDHLIRLLCTAFQQHTSKVSFHAKNNNAFLIMQLGSKFNHFLEKSCRLVNICRLNFLFDVQIWR
jgi:hypothetical protein